MNPNVPSTPPADKPKLLETVREVLRRKHYSLRTEDAYLDWVKRFVLFHGKRHPRDMGAAEIQAFLTHLAVADNVAASVLIPDHRFLSWSGFVKDGQWKLAVQPPTKDKGGYLRLESRRWTFVTKQIEGTYPSWRNITDDVRQFSGYIEVSEQAAEAMALIVPRLPGDDMPNHTVGLYCVSGRLYLRGVHKD